MDEVLVVFLAGFAASLVDGALGMGFGPTSSSILLGYGISPVAVSTTVNVAKVATGATGAIAHWRFDNVDRRLVRRLAVPGAIGALVGATVLASVDGDALRPVLAGLLVVMAARILLRFSRPLPVDPGGEQDGASPPVDADDRATAAVAATGGVSNGLVGAWGPVVTPYLLHRGLAPRYAVGSVNTAEVAVAVVAAGSLLGSAGGAGVDPAIVAAMLGGGVLAAPLAAWSIRFLPARGLGIAVGGLLLLTNIRVLLSAPIGAPVEWLAYALVVLACAGAAVRPRFSPPVPGAAG